MVGAAGVCADRRRLYIFTTYSAARAPRYRATQMFAGTRAGQFCRQRFWDCLEQALLVCGASIAITVLLFFLIPEKANRPLTPRSRDNWAKQADRDRRRLSQSPVLCAG